MKWEGILWVCKGRVKGREEEEGQKMKKEGERKKGNGKLLSEGVCRRGITG